jgi:hypothetical protein
MVSSTNKTDCHVITEILLKVALNTITQISNPKDCITLKFTIDKLHQNFWWLKNYAFNKDFQGKSHILIIF